MKITLLTVGYAGLQTAVLSKQEIPYWISLPQASSDSGFSNAPEREKGNTVGGLPASILDASALLLGTTIGAPLTGPRYLCVLAYFKSFYQTAP